MLLEEIKQMLEEIGDKRMNLTNTLTKIAAVRSQYNDKLTDAIFDGFVGELNCIDDLYFRLTTVFIEKKVELQQYALIKEALLSIPEIQQNKVLKLNIQANL
jgi:hypothetical protein